MEGFVHSTESFGTVDGPGIRYVVFLQGCPMRCKYCHNPDTWEIGVSKTMDTASILEDYECYKSFLKNGGITVTGGEPLLQLDFVTELFTKAKSKGIHTCIDTSGITFSVSNKERFKDLLDVTDLVILDIKHIDPDKHKDLTGCSNEPVLLFAKLVSDCMIPIWIRHVVVPGITDDPKYLEDLGYFIGGLISLRALDVLPYHDMGISKYNALNIPYPLASIRCANDDDALKAREYIMSGVKRKLNARKQ